MNLREGEQALRVYHHHLTPFIFDMVKVILGAVPVYFMLFALGSALSGKVYFLVHFFVFVVFVLVVVYVSLIYWLDKLIITSQRIIHVDWKYLSVRDESDLELSLIQDIQTHERGWLSHFSFFDYGKLLIDTASSYIALEFNDAPNPEEIRRYIYHVKNQ